MKNSLFLLKRIVLMF